MIRITVKSYTKENGQESIIARGMGRTRKHVQSVYRDERLSFEHVAEALVESISPDSFKLSHDDGRCEAECVIEFFYEIATWGTINPAGARPPGRSETLSELRDKCAATSRATVAEQHRDAGTVLKS